MIRVLSALVLLPAVLGVIWFLPPIATLILALAAALVGVIEYADLAQRAAGADVPRAISAAAVLTACASVGMALAPLEIVLMTAMILAGLVAVAAGAPGPAVLRDAAASVFPILYIGLPLGAIVAVRTMAGREAVLLLLATIVTSDSAQYYTGRAFGRTKLAPAISPNKTRAGAVGGVLFGTLAMTAGALWVFPAAPPALVALTACAIVGLGMAGDLFESLLKRSAGVKDSGALIPGHGGVLDRIDSWLFAAPVYYVFVRYMQAP